MLTDEKKLEVFKIARDIATKEGLSSLTIRRLSKESDISVGSIYNLFGTKDNLIMELIEDYWISSLREIMADEKLNEGSFIERLEYLYINFKKTSSDFHDDWIRDMVGMNMSNPHVLEKSNKYKGIMEDKIREMILEDEDVKSALDPEFNLDELASFVFENIMILLSNDEDTLGFFALVLERALEIR